MSTDDTVTLTSETDKAGGTQATVDTGSLGQLTDEDLTLAHINDEQPFHRSDDITPATDEPTYPALRDEQIELFEREVQVTPDKAAKGFLLFQLAHMHCLRNDVAAAIRCHREAHQLHSTLRPNIRAYRSLLIKTNQVKDAMPLFESELALSTSGIDKAAVLTSRAFTRLDHLSDISGAVSDIKEALSHHPKEALLLHLFARVQCQSGDHKKAAKTIEKQVELHSDARIRSALLCFCGELFQRSEAATQAALEAFTQAAREDPLNDHAHRRMIELALEAGDASAETQATLRLAECYKKDSQAALYLRAGQLMSSRCDQADLALQTLQSMKPQETTSLPITEFIASVANTCHRHNDEIRSLRQSLTAKPSHNELTKLLFRLAERTIAHGDEPCSSEMLRALWPQSPSHYLNFILLEKYYLSTNQHEELAEFLSSSARQADDFQTACTIYHRLGSLLKHEINDLERAIEALCQATSIVPNHRPSIQLLAKLYRETNRYDDLVALYERDISFFHDPDEKAIRLQQIANIWEQHLENPAAAIDAYERLIAIDPDNPSGLRSLRRLYRLGNRWNDLCETLRVEATHTRDEFYLAGLLTRAGYLLFNKLENSEDAISRYHEVLRRSPDYLPALIGIGKVLLREKRFEELETVHRQQLSNESDPERRTWLLIKIGRLSSEKLEKFSDAYNAFREAAQTSDSIAADVCLARLVNAKTDHPHAPILGGRASLENTSPISKLAHRLRGEALLEGSNFSKALQHLNRAADSNATEYSFHQLLTLYTERKLWSQMFELIENSTSMPQDPDMLAPVLFRAGVGLLVGTRDNDRAHKVFEKLSDMYPRSIIFSRQLAHLQRQSGSWRDLCSTLKRISSQLKPSPDRQASLAQLASVYYWKLKDLRAAAVVYKDLLEKQPFHVEAQFVVEQHARAQGDTTVLLHILQKKIEDTRSHHERSALMIELAGLYFKKKSFAEAADCFRRAADMQPDHLLAIRGWQHAAKKAGDKRQRAIAVGLEAEASTSARRKALLTYQAGKLWEQSPNGAEKALSCFKRVLTHIPDHQGAIDARIRILSQTEAHSALLRAYQHQFDSETDPHRLRQAFVSAAQLQKSMQHFDGAIRTIDRGLRMFPNDRGLMHMTADFSRESKDWQGLANILEQLLSTEKSDANRFNLHCEAAELYTNHLSQRQKAKFHFREARKYNERDPSLLRQLGALCLQDEDWDEALSCYEDITQFDADRHRVKEAFLTISEICIRRNTDIERAIVACRRALSLDPADLSAALRLADIYARRNDLGSLKAHIASAITVHRARLHRSPEDPASYYALERIAAYMSQDDQRYVYVSLLCFLGEENSERMSYVQRVRAHHANTRRRPITSATWQVLLGDSERRLLTNFVKLVTPVLAKVIEPPFIVKGESDLVRISSRSHNALFHLANLISSTFQLKSKSFGLYYSEHELPTAIVTIRRPAPTVIISKRAMNLPTQELSFLLARSLARIGLGYDLFMSFDEEEFSSAIAASIAAYVSSFSPEILDHHDDELISEIQKCTARRDRDTLQQLALELSDLPFSPRQWRERLRYVEDTFALLGCGDPWAACCVTDREETLRKTVRNPDNKSHLAERTKEILTFATSDIHFSARSQVFSLD